MLLALKRASAFASGSAFGGFDSGRAPSLSQFSVGVFILFLITTALFI
jgi:hypothetical protein